MPVVAFPFTRRTRGATWRCASALRIAAVAAVIGCLPAGQSLAFDGNTRAEDQPALLPPANVPLAAPGRPVDEAFRTGAQALRLGETAKGVDALRYAADQGHPAAQWKLARMYADGEGVKRDDAKAFDYYSRIANTHAEDYPGTAQARFVASAFVALGSYYLAGIPNSAIRRDPGRARDMYFYAASYFGDPDAQFRLGKLYMEGTGVARDPRQAARWLILSSQKGQYEAQAMLGSMLFRGDEGIGRQGARGLMWLTLARDSAAGPEDKWIVDLYEYAFSEATPDERAAALKYLEQWLKTAQR
ncbi:MAG: transcriptional regulator [Rhizobiales bacterium 32-66-8]|nr:MAG: transcriptional regulator [Rhizobiales bacterium 32-66-8]